MRYILILLTLLLPSGLLAHDVEKGGIHIADPWIKAPIGQGKVAAGYLQIIDMGGDGDRLLGARSDIADRVELHTHFTDNGVMRMRGMDGLDISPMADSTLEPGGHHLMIMGLKRKLKLDEKIRITLTFKGVGDVVVPFKVLKSEPE